MIFAILFTIVISSMSLVRKKSKLITVFFFIFIFILFGWNYWNGDYDAYESLYNFPILEVNTDGYEWGYTGLMIFFNSKGYVFQQFFIIMALLSLVLFFNFIIRYSHYPAFFITCFFFCFFPLDYVLLRNFIAFTILLQGLIFVIENYKYSICIYIFFVFIASLFHGTALFYLSLLFCFKSKKLNVVFVSLVVFIVTLIFVSKGNAIINVIYGSTGGRDEFYDSSFYRFLYNSFMQVVNWIIIRHYYNNSLQLKGISEKENRFNLILMNINIILLFVIPIYYTYGIAIRLFRNIAIINTLFMINVIMKNGNATKRAQLYFLLFLYIGYFYFSFVQPYFHDTIYSLYNYNLLFSSL